LSEVYSFTIKTLIFMKKCSSRTHLQFFLPHNLDQYLPLGTYALQAVYRGQSFSKTIIKQ
jgi:hypothetical protein